MKDVQNQPDRRRIPIWKAGIKNLQYPVAVMDRENKVQHTVATVNLYVDLPHNFKGTHMSRFVEILNRHRGRISLRNLKHILRAMVARFESTMAHLEVYFPYFIEKAAPVSGAKSLMNYQCAFLASFDRNKRKRPIDLIVRVSVPVTTLCPCSKAISEGGAHNQRSWITLHVRTHTLVWIEELIEMAEAEASAGLYSLLKREDEKSVTEQAFNRPLFAEDVVRAVALRLKKDRRIGWYQVESENLESIHNHNAYAMVVSHERRL
ncbi:MAG: GTP cyclohydrolase I FolE2 [Lentisphaerae bacterium]|nr:GTP cyclohydrolase I FolE2 [Lentisphaerota bacterium]